MVEYSISIDDHFLYVSFHIYSNFKALIIFNDMFDNW